MTQPRGFSPSSARHSPSQISRWWQRLLVLIAITLLALPSVTQAENYNRRIRYPAYVNITYWDARRGRTVTESRANGLYGQTSPKSSEEGIVVHVRSRDNKTDGCSPPVNVPGGKIKWIALIRRGGCRFTKKIRNAAVNENASAVVIYDYQSIEGLVTMEHTIDDVVAIFITKRDGEHIAQLVDNGTKVTMSISVAPGEHDLHGQNMNKTSVIFVSVSFIVLIIISLGWLVFYYIQRFRYAHAKERLSKRLTNAAKKAITNMPLRTLKTGEKEVCSPDYQCAVCIEGYKHHEMVRILPCSHFFHKSCVDPWLIDQRNCPMCKMDILKAYGLQVRGASQENLNSGDREEFSIAMLPAEATTSYSDMEVCPGLFVDLPSNNNRESAHLSEEGPSDDLSHHHEHHEAHQIDDHDETHSLMPPSTVPVAPSQSDVTSLVTHHVVDAAVTTSTTVPAVML